MRDSYVLRDPNVEMTDSLPVVGHMAVTAQKFVYNTGSKAIRMPVLERKKVGQPERGLKYNFTINLR